MPSTYYCILTTTGQNKLASAQANQTPLPLTQFCVGDSNGLYYDPTGNEAALVHEVWRGNVNRVYVHATNPSWIVVEALIPADVGGFDIREAGVLDDIGALIAIAKYPMTNKPAPGSGSEKDLYVRMIFQVTNATSVQQTIDSSLVFATKDYVDTEVIAHAMDTNNPHGVTPVQIGAETPAGAQAKVDAHVADADPHPQYAADIDLSNHTSAPAPHSGHETPAGAQAKVDAHASLTNNPHATTATQVGAIPVGGDAGSVAGRTPGTTPGKLAYYDANGRVVDSGKLQNMTPQDIINSVSTTITGTLTDTSTQFNGLEEKEVRIATGVTNFKAGFVTLFARQQANAHYSTIPLFPAGKTVVNVGRKGTGTYTDIVLKSFINDSNYDYLCYANGVSGSGQIQYRGGYFDMATGEIVLRFYCNNSGTYYMDAVINWEVWI